MVKCIIASMLMSTRCRRLSTVYSNMFSNNRLSCVNGYLMEVQDSFFQDSYQTSATVPTIAPTSITCNRSRPWNAMNICNGACGHHAGSATLFCKCECPNYCIPIWPQSEKQPPAVAPAPAGKTTMLAQPPQAQRPLLWAQ